MNPPARVSRAYFTQVLLRISIDPGQELAARLAPGMSVVASIDTNSDAGTPVAEKEERLFLERSG